MAKKSKILSLKLLGFISLQGLIAIIRRDVIEAWNSLEFLNSVIARFYN